MILVAVLLMLACPPIGVAVLAAELAVCGGLAVLCVRAARVRCYPCPRRAG
jgi:hypothetical protein